MKLKSKLLLALLAVSGLAFADEAAAPEDSLTYNVGGVSQYRYRGLSQTKGKPALQGGADFAAASGWYVGTWASTISWIADAGNAASPKVSVNGPLELDLYGGYKFDLNGVGMDVGYLKYQYVGNQLAQLGQANGFVNANSDEVYAAATVGAFTLKDSYSLGTLFGVAGSKGSQYLDLSATFDLGEGYSLVPHVGRQVFAGSNATGNNALYNYTDYAATLNKDMGKGLSLSVAALGTNANRSMWTQNDANYFQGRKALVLGAKYAF